MLDTVPNVMPASRLSCQLIYSEELDGLTVALDPNLAAKARADDCDRFAHASGRQLRGQCADGGMHVGKTVVQRHGREPQYVRRAPVDHDPGAMQRGHQRFGFCCALPDAQ